jgi:pyridoxal phosphate enzyme (YggS family)
VSANLDRRGELAANLADFATKVRTSCEVAGRDPDEITVIAVTKTFPASDVFLLADLAVTDVGENRDQEAAPKHEECASLPLRWHFVGGLQRNKCRSVAQYADVVHSIDRSRLVDALSVGAVAAGRTIDCLIQVSLDPPTDGRSPGEPGGRSGALPADVIGLADQVATAAGLQIAGVMAVAPLGADPDDAFTRLAEVAAELRAVHPGATVISAGMSGDFAAAIRHGATHLRVGTALLGRRSVPVG